MLLLLVCLVSCFLLSGVFLIFVGLMVCGGLRWCCLFCYCLRVLVIVCVVDCLDVVCCFGFVVCCLFG